MLQPVAVTLIAQPGQPLDMTIGKTWTDAERRVSTGAEGVVTERLRTDDVAQIVVKSPAGERSFDLIIWVGDERSDYPDMPTSIDYGKRELTKVVPPAAGQPAPPAAGQPAPPAAPPAASTGGSQTVLWIIAALLGAAVLLGAVALLRRKS